CACFFFFQAEDGIRDWSVTGVQTCALPICLFHEGRMRIQRGPGARALYLLEKHYPLRYKARDRMLAYRRAFGAGTLAPPPGAVEIGRASCRERVKGSLGAGPLNKKRQAIRQ